jgi:hypothetical protein
MNRPGWFKVMVARWPSGLLKKTLKETYLRFQPYDGPTLFPVRGPDRCGLVSEIAAAAGGSHTTIWEGGTYDFPLPESDNPALTDFFAQYAHSEHPPVTLSQIPGGHTYANGVVLSPDGSMLARDVSIDFTHPFESHYLLNRPIYRSRLTHSYYHWLLDELPRHLLPDLPDYDQVVCSRNTGVCREAMQHLGLDKKPIHFLDKVKHYQCDSLIVPSYIATIGQPSPYLVERLTQAVTHLISPLTSYPEKLFISRQLAGVRRVVNEDSLFQLLEPQGFTRIRLENFSWKEQINLFYHAREIIAPHGAGLANLVFCAQKPLVIELFNANYVHWCFWHLAMLTDANYVPLIFPNRGKAQQLSAEGVSDITIDGLHNFIAIYKSLRD